MNDEELAAGLAETPGYRYAEVVGAQLFVAGQVPHDAAGEIVGPGDPRAQAISCLDNLARLVAVHGFSIDDVRFLTVYVVGPQASLTEAWDGVRGWFDGEVPPATLLGVNLLGHDGQLVEIDATIIRSDGIA